MNSISNNIDEIIINAVKNFDNSYDCNNPFEKLLGFGELVDRLSIINFKLYRLKDEVMNRPNDEKFRAWASIEDVKLVEERARLKKCIDEKMLAVISRVMSGDNRGGINSEVKKYGDNRI